MYNGLLISYIGQWKQWNSDVGVVSNCMCFVIAHCSAQVKGLAFTGYSATPKTGIVTKMNGPRHIISIDNQPAGSTTQCPRIDLNKTFLSRPKATTA